MFTLIFASVLAIIIANKIYEMIKYKEKPDGKNWLYLVFAILIVAATFLEKIFKIEI